MNRRFPIAVIAASGLFAVSADRLAAQDEDAPQPPVEVTACIGPGPEVHRGTEEQVVVPVTDGDMTILQSRGFTYRQSLTSVSDPRLEGTLYQAVNQDDYTLPGDEPSAGISDSRPTGLVDRHVHQPHRERRGRLGGIGRATGLPGRHDLRGPAGDDRGGGLRGPDRHRRLCRHLERLRRHGLHHRRQRSGTPHTTNRAVAGVAAPLADTRPTSGCSTTALATSPSCFVAGSALRRGRRPAILSTDGRCLCRVVRGQTLTLADDQEIRDAT